MSLLEAIEYSCSIEEPTDYEVEQAIELLAGMSIEEFSKRNISQYDVEALALADESFVEHCVSLELSSFDSIDDYVNPSKYAYHLAYSNPELATQLLDELLYYRSMNRI
jgi:hypothetical protein